MVKTKTSKTPAPPSPDRDRRNVCYLFTEICKFCALYSKSVKAISAGSVDGRIAIHYLNRLEYRLPKVIPNFAGSDFEFKHSKGQPALPRVPWLSIVPRGHFVATNLSVTICFGRNGDGAVVGLMNAASTPSQRVKTVIRTKSKGLIIDVDGAKPGTKYNDLFLNPKEFLVEAFDAEALGKHIAASIVLLKKQDNFR